MTSQPQPPTAHNNFGTPSQAAPSRSAASIRKTPRRRLRLMADEQQEDLSPVLVGVYIRVSLAREEMISPELQQRDVDAYLARMTAQTRRTWRTVVVEQDLDISGRSFARAGIQRLMELMREGAITTILTYRYDRFGRNLEQALSHLREVEQAGGQVVSVSEPFDASTAIGHFMRSQTLAMAELQSQQIGEGWKRVHQKRIADGLPTNGRERYGYLGHRTSHQRGDGLMRVCPQGCAPGECRTGFVPDPDTGAVVQRIYRDYINGIGFQAIAHALNDEDFPSPGVVAAERSGNPTRITKLAGARWSAGSVIDITDSGFAAGLISHHHRWHAGAHEPLISQQTWQAYQQRREAQRLTPTKARSPKWVLAGVAVCGGCGGPMYCTSSPRGEQYALYCGTARTSGVCEGVYRTRQPVEDAVAVWLRSITRVPRPGSKLILPEAVVEARDPHEAERRRLSKILEASQTKIRRLTDAYTDGVLELADYKVRREVVQAETEAARERLAELDEPPAQPPAHAELTAIAECWGSDSIEERRRTVQALLLKVTVNSDKSVRLYPRWDSPITITFTRRGRVPQLPASSDA